MHLIWHIPEIFIHIASHLDLHDLAHCHHVSHHWQTTLKYNLPPRLQPLPDSPASYSLEQKSISDTIRTFAASIESKNEHCTSLAEMVCLGDFYFYWRQGELAMMLERLKPQLHPFLAARASKLVCGLEAVAKGEMEVSLYTQCSVANLLHLDNDSGRWWKLPLTYPPVECVEVSCLEGAKWDLTNKSVLFRAEGTRRVDFVRVERKEGVRMCEVLDELRGVLALRTECADDCELMLEWQLGRTQSKSVLTHVLC
jgi:hypothetical protein